MQTGVMNRRRKRKVDRATMFFPMIIINSKQEMEDLVHIQALDRLKNTEMPDEHTMWTADASSRVYSSN